eukprot:CAMPEP_0197688296 /NCGR_PEP_ID=MMETSP1338-20131121/105218_1 /TAXON_ID=43686 ORGANISM="Pelagodinium beii, Strain RCC1491" /NCGR_SAMPLE_ID=MMETSP1338 /ASSEMBLY_ACC=CAM_ASM_000754 /LENGTH=40 /DNA_ID= /DNA_START= /DNA_END= /DNA_ORIENTATION=
MKPKVDQVLNLVIMCNVVQMGAEGQWTDENYPVLHLVYNS